MIGTFIRRSGLAAILALPLALAGCGATGIELHGSVFEAMGVAGNLNQRSEEPVIEARGPLVVPPSTEALPSPEDAAATAATPASATVAWPNDPDLAKSNRKVAAAKEREEYCENGNWDNKKRTIDDFENNQLNRYGRCGSILTKIFNPEKSTE